MDSCDSGVTSPPLLRLTAEISSQHKPSPQSRSREDEKASGSPASTSSKEGRPLLFARKKILNPLYGHNPYTRSNYAGSYLSTGGNPRSNVSAFTQRVMSAKLLRTKQLQNQLAETQMKLNEALHENKILRTLQHRQDNVLKKYEGGQEQLPQLLKSHHEEIRVLNEKYKQLRSNYRELESRSKQKDVELTGLREQYRHLLKLSRDKHLGEREKLSQQVQELEGIIDQQKTKIMNLDKKLQIEEKNHRHQLNQETNKLKKTQSELNSALETINNLKATIEAKERFASASYPRFGQSAPSQHPPRPTHVSLPPPPRVSIRQTHRVAHSDGGLQHQPEDSETAESLSINYSPGEGGSSSGGESENLEDTVSGVRGGGGLLELGGIHITKAQFKERRLARKELPANPLLPANKRGKVELARQNSGRPIKDEPKKENEKRKKSLTRNNQDSKESKEKSTENPDEPQKHVINRSLQKPQIENPKKYAHLETEEDRLFTQIENEINLQEMKIDGGDNMKIEMDDEFEKLLEGTKLSDEAISEYFKRDFRAEISEIEQKFKDLDKASEKYMHLENKINGATFKNDSSVDTISDEEDAVSKEERRKDDDELLKKINDLTIQKRPNGIVLGESEKASLLKALSNIDETYKPLPGVRIEESKDVLSTQEVSTAVSNSTAVPPPASSSTATTRSYVRTNKKSIIMQDLFGADGTKI